MPLSTATVSMVHSVPELMVSSEVSAPLAGAAFGKTVPESRERICGPRLASGATGEDTSSVVVITVFPVCPRWPAGLCGACGLPAGEGCAPSSSFPTRSRLQAAPLRWAPLGWELFRVLQPDPGLGELRGVSRGEGRASRGLLPGEQGAEQEGGGVRSGQRWLRGRGVEGEGPVLCFHVQRRASAGEMSGKKKVAFCTLPCWSEAS